ncbi:hypothetical protein CY34DRAFT_800737 [Suillus luteus UH-Slu-Lm8-n1]|uniref:Uncharacterized protein n=1 Tax=Suillus luteus UH-Slu-Lm8-n1 TaxID=930992 RepID=A0A0D0B8S1_9AGAM|nr:hypothetical protein CY34DRAFT_800737 [Suillus luteus UH-Slu-Lm8-n1]
MQEIEILIEIRRGFGKMQPRVSTTSESKDKFARVCLWRRTEEALRPKLQWVRVHFFVP